MTTANSHGSDEDFADLHYQIGFGNHFCSEALPGALPVGQNNPLICPYGLYAEQISGTAFTAPRATNQRSWLYRIKPSVTHEPFTPRIPNHEFLVGDFSTSENVMAAPTQLRWRPKKDPDMPTDFIDGLYTVCGAGSPFLRHGYTVHLYAANKSMDNYAFANADGDLLIVPQEGRLFIKTEFGKMQASPGEVVVLQQGFRFNIILPDGPSRGYVAEVFDGHFQLPELGPIGANGLAAPRDFQVPTAWFDDCHYPGYKIVQKFGGELFEAKQDFCPFNVVAWQGNYVPYKYDLTKFCPFNTVLFDHADPSINTVLSVPSERPGVAVLDLVVFPPRWLTAEHTFRPPYFHRNCMSEFMGLIRGVYEGKAKGFLPGGSSLHTCMTPHGVDTITYEDAMGEKRKRQKSSLVSLTVRHGKQEHGFGDKLEEVEFGVETQHFFERSSEDYQKCDVETSVYENERIRIRPDFVLEEPQYAGAKSNRKVAFDEDSTSISELSGKDEFFNENDSQSFDQNSGEEQGDVQGLHSESLDEEMETLNKEYMELRAQEEEILHGLKGRIDEEVQKSTAVSHQKGLWDKALEIRILLQKSFSNANRLPLKSIKSDVCETNAEVQDAYLRLNASSIKTLECLTETLKALMEQNNFVSEACPASANGDMDLGPDNEAIPLGQSPSTIDQLWHQLDSSYSRFVLFRNSSVDRWQRKTQLSSGVAAAKHKLRAFNQSISQQVEMHMRDPSRMCQRMSLKRSSVDIFGMPVGGIDGNYAASLYPAATETHTNNEDADYDPELIDDTEFYQELLREFLESSDPASIGSVYAARRLQNKKRKVVDRRASKGRKIRYNVHEKIVNFMAPVPMNLPPMAEKLFSNLFGQSCQGNV